MSRIDSQGSSEDVLLSAVLAKGARERAEGPGWFLVTRLTAVSEAARTPLWCRGLLLPALTVLGNVTYDVGPDGAELVTHGPRPLVEVFLLFRYCHPQTALIRYDGPHASPDLGRRAPGGVSELCPTCGYRGDGALN